jgi:DnaJ-class molecular chaperone
MMSQVTEAFEVLGDVGKKELYDNGVADLVLNENETDYFSTVVTKSV